MKKNLLTFQQKKETVKRDWHLVDLNEKVLGRTATEIAKLLIGKHKPTYTSHVDVGDYVVVVNATKVVVTGNKRVGKIYTHHSQYPSGLKQENFEHLIKRNPKKLIEEAVWGMLPKNKLRDPRMKRLKVFANEDHIYSQKFTTNK
jgi:large subunit ribosomal protein L13